MKRESPTLLMMLEDSEEDIWESFPERRLFAGCNSCVLVPPGSGRTSAISHNSFSLSSQPNHKLANAAIAFNSPLPTTQADRQVGNYCHIRLMPMTTANLC